MVVLLVAKSLEKRSRFSLIVVMYLGYGFFCPISPVVFSKTVFGRGLMLPILLDLRKQAVPLCRSTRRLHYNYSHELFDVSILKRPIYPGVHGQLRRACKGHREYMMFIDYKHTMHV